MITSAEREELENLRKEMQLHSLGDKPTSIAAHKLKRLIELEALEKTRNTEVGFCWVCRSSHILTAANCRAMDSIA